jgi:hypothetical protein
MERTVDRPNQRVKFHLNGLASVDRGWRLRLRGTGGRFWACHIARHKDKLSLSFAG